jgi:hypothetical protein
VPTINNRRTDSIQRHWILEKHGCQCLSTWNGLLIIPIVSFKNHKVWNPAVVLIFKNMFWEPNIHVILLFDIVWDKSSPFRQCGLNCFSFFCHFVYRYVYLCTCLKIIQIYGQWKDNRGYASVYKLCCNHENILQSILQHIYLALSLSVDA